MYFASGDDPFQQSGEKLRAAKISPWVLTFEGGKGTLTFMEDILTGNEGGVHTLLRDWEVFVRELIHPDDQKIVQAAITRLLDDPQACCQVECRVRNSCGSTWNWVFVYGTVDEVASDGTVLRISGGIQNTRERVENKRLSASLDAVLTAAELGAWDWNIQTGEVIYNKIWADIAGRELDDIQGLEEAWASAVLPEDLPKALEAVEAHVRGETPMYEAEFRMHRGDGSVIWAVDRGRVVERDAEGNALRLVGVLQDISASKAAGEELTQTVNQLELVIRETNFGTWDWNPITNDIVFNDIFFSLLGYEKGEFEPTLAFWLALIHPDDVQRAQEALATLLTGESVDYECEMRLRHKNGYYIWIYDKGRAIAWDSEGQVTRVLGGHLDIDKLKQQEQEQQDALATIAMQKQFLERTVEERTTLLHDVRRRIGEILAATGYLPEDSAPPVVHQPHLPPHLSPHLPEDALQPHLPPPLPPHLSEDGENTFPFFVGEEDLSVSLPFLSSEDVYFPRPGDNVESLEKELGKAFDLITEKMWWYKGVIDSIPFPIFVTDMERRWTYLNSPALENISADSLRDVLGKPEEQWGEDTELSQKDSGKGRRFNRYNPARKRFFQGQASFLLNQKDDRIGHIEVMQDVTRIHEADQRTRIMLDSMPQVCAFWDADLNLIDSNLAAMNLFRLSSKEEFREKFYALSPLTQPDGRLSREGAQEHLRRALEQGRDQFEWLHQTLDGTPIMAEVTLVRFESGNERSILSYIRDLTELKRKEDELDKERRLLRKIMDTSPVCFVIFVDDVVRSATPFAQNFFGASVGAKAADLYANEQECSDFLRDVREFGSINWRIVSMRAADGSTREMLVNAFLAEYYEEPCVMSWFLDITEMRETERQLRLARDAAEENARAKGEFLANMSHEIRTPMNAILGMARLVLDTELTTKQRDYLEKAERSARALLRILNDILDFSKIEAGKLEMENTEFRVDEVLRDVTDMLREGAQAKGLDLVLTLDMPESLYVQGDSLRLHQILTNLIGNAIKFTRQGGVYVHAALKERAKDSATFSFHVRDTGIGLGQEQLGRLFSAFSQADTSTTRRYGGTGLGLAISKRLVEMMQGEIVCVSEQGQGAEFSFRAVFALPPVAHDAAREDERGHPIPAASRDPRELVAHLKGKRLLLAEDHDINQIVARETLEHADFTVEIAENGREAIEMALAKQYDLIFMDIQMPEMDGLAAAAELRRHPHLRDIPIVAMTAHAMSGDREKSLAVGMNDHITKPIDPEKVFAVIAKWLPPEVPEFP